MKTVCQTRPEMCEPRNIKYVAFDADDTMWNISPPIIASSITGKLTKIDDDTVVAEGRDYWNPYQKGSEKPKKPAPPYRPETPPRKIQISSAPELDLTISKDEERDIDEWWKTKIAPKTKEVNNIAKEVVSDLPPGLRDKYMVAIEQVTGKTVEMTRVKTEKPAPPVEKKPPEPPPKKEYTTYGSPERITIKLLPTFRETLTRLNEANIPVGVISLNTPGSVKRILEAFGIADRFADIRDSWDNKGKVFDELTAKHKVCPCNGLFLDNTLGHVEDVSKKCGLGLVIGKDDDVEKPIEILKFMANLEEYK